MYKTLNFLYGCETWSVLVREENRVKVLESRVVLKRIFGTQGEEVIGGWRKLSSEMFNPFTK
jgi:hypothetical protein